MRAVFVVVLLLALVGTSSGALKPVVIHTVGGKQVTWFHREPVGFGQVLKTYFWDRVVNVLLNDKEAKYGCRGLSTAVIIDKNRILTSFTPFRQFEKNLTVISQMIAYVAIGRGNSNDPGGTINYHLHDVWSGRQITYTPEESIPFKSWHGRGENRHTPLHDLMVLRVKPDFITKFQFSNLKESEVVVGKGNLVFNMTIAEPDEELEYPLRYCQLNVDGERDRQYFDFTTEDDVIVDCDYYIPNYWGHFLCLRNIHGLRSLPSGAILVSNLTVFGIGSFAYNREDVGILVFTDVRPYYDLIMQTMTDGDTQ